MKNYDELAERVFRKAEERITKKKIRMMRLKRTSIAVSGMCTVILVMFGIWKNDAVKNALNDDFNKKNFITSESDYQTSPAVTTTVFTSPLGSVEVTQTSAAASAEPEFQTTAGSIASATESYSSQTTQTALPETSPGANTSASTTTAQSGSNANEAAETTSRGVPSIITTTSSASVTTTRVSTTKTSALTSTSATRTTTIFTSSRTLPPTTTTTSTTTTFIWASASGLPTTTTTTSSAPPNSDEGIPVHIRYPTLVIECESLRPWHSYETTTEYVGVSSDLSADRIGEYIETVEIADITGNISVSAEVYSITKMSPIVCAAIKIEGRNGYSLYRNCYYTPAALGDMINDMNLLEEARFVSAEWINIEENWRRNVYLDESVIFEKLFTDYSVPNGTNLEYVGSYFRIYIDIPFLNKTNDVIFLSANGLASTTIIDFNAFFDIGTDNIDSLMNYVLENNLYTESPMELE